MRLKDFLNAFKTKNTDDVRVHLNPEQTDHLLDMIEKHMQDTETRFYKLANSCEIANHNIAKWRFEVFYYINNLEKELKKSERLLKKYHKLLTENELCMNDWEAKYKLILRTRRTLTSIKKLKDEHETKKNAETVK